jgi:hypothetical protein
VVERVHIIILCILDTRDTDGTTLIVVVVVGGGGGGGGGCDNVK